VEKLLTSAASASTSGASRLTVARLLTEPACCHIAM